MKQSALASQYVIQPPSFPDFLFKSHIQPMEELVEWSKREYQARLIYCAEHGYWRELKYINEEYSPYRILAELRGFRRYVSLLSYNARWATARKYMHRFVSKAFSLREDLFRAESSEIQLQNNSRHPISAH